MESPATFVIASIGEISMIHWEEGENDRGLAVWLRYVEYSHWGLILTATLPRWNLRIPGLDYTFIPS